MSSDLTKINDWAYKWKMSFNLGRANPANVVVFNRKKIETHLLLMINVPVKRVPFHKHLGLILDPKPGFNEHINTVLYEVNKNRLL